MARCIMVQGTMSGVGKSLLVTALCRIFRQDGFRAAPFKSQNMALNSYITRDGLEMGRAQAVQAQAAGLEPDVRMNPILLKPNSDTGSQVIVNGRVWGSFPAREYFRRKKSLIPEILSAYRSLAAENDIIVIEGAGSPAEINLRADDIVNMGLAELVNAPVLLAGDIDRGGVFAQLYGTLSLLAPAERQRVIGTVINQFRGDVSLLESGLVQLEQLTGVPVAGVVPYLDVDLEDEDSLAPRLHRRGVGALDVAVIRLPHLSNFTDFAPLERHPLIGLRYVKRLRELGRPDLLILPGSKNTMDDLRWLRTSGLEAAIQRLSAQAVPVLGICGGYQMLGKALTDGADARRGMGLLDCETVFLPDKHTAQVSAVAAAPPFTGCPIEGYELHMGSTVVGPGCQRFARLSDGREEGAVAGLVWGTYLHGLFDRQEMVSALVQYLLLRTGTEGDCPDTQGQDAYRERQFDLLAQGVRQSLDLSLIYREMERFAHG